MTCLDRFFRPLRRTRVTSLLLAGGAAAVFFAAPAAAQNYPLLTGYDRLYARLQGFVPTGQTIVMGQVEANNNGAYLPDFTNPIFAQVNFEIEDGPGGTLVHATDVGRLLYAPPLSLTDGITHVKLFCADPNISFGFLIAPPELNIMDPAGPGNIGVDVLNNSWVYNTGSQALSTQLVRRLDWLADAYDIMVVGGVVNDATVPIPALTSSMYNGMAVGLSTDPSSLGPTVFEEIDGTGPGRCKPDIVAPFTVSSAATPLVSSYAALLLDEVHIRLAAGETNFQMALKPAVIKSLLMTGANKLAGWAKGDPTTTADDEVTPLDFKQGAGQVDIDHSELMLSTGLQPPGWVYELGWTYEQGIAPGDSRLYIFPLNEDSNKRFAATLNWNRKIFGTGVSMVDSAQLAHLQLEFFSVADDGSISFVEASRSPVDNLQHIAVPELPNGLYIMRVLNVGDLPADYALSWGCLPDTEPDANP